MTDTSLVRSENPTPSFFSSKIAAPGRLRWAESTYVAAYRPARSRLVLAAFALVWNSAFFFISPAFRMVSVPVAIAFVTVLLLLTIREILLVVRVQMDTDRVIVARVPSWPWPRFSVPLTSIERFVVVQHPTDGSFRLEAIVHGAGSQRVPISFDGPPVRGNWSPRGFFNAPAESYSFAAERLNAILDAAKHRTGPTYR